MNWVMVNPHFGPVLGGIQKDMLSLAREFMSQGDQVAFVTTYDEFPGGRVDLSQPFTYELPSGIRIVRLEGYFRTHLRHFHPTNPPLWLPGLARAVLQFKPGAVIFFNIGWPLTILPALLTIRRHSTVLYQTAYHAPLERHPLDPWRSRLQLGVTALSHQLIPHSYFEKRQIMRDGGIPEGKITVIYPGVGIWEFTPDEIQNFCFRYDLVGKVVISHVARLGAFKGTGTLIRALPHVRSRTDSDVVLLLVGRNMEKDYLDGLVHELGVLEHVRFTGPLSERDLHLAYAVSHIFALPSQYESFGFVFLEAMAHGVPVIGVRTGGVPEVIRDGETGFILDSWDDIRGLQKALEHLILDQSLRKEMGERARHSVQDRFIWHRAAAEFKELIARIQSA